MEMGLESVLGYNTVSERLERVTLVMLGGIWKERELIGKMEQG